MPAPPPADYSCSSSSANILNQLQQQRHATITDLKTQLDAMQQVLLRQEEIKAGLVQFYSLAKEDAALEQKIHPPPAITDPGRAADPGYKTRSKTLYKNQMQQLRARQQALDNQQQDLIPILQRTEEISTARQQFFWRQSADCTISTLSSSRPSPAATTATAYRQNSGRNTPVCKPAWKT